MVLSAKQGQLSSVGNSEERNPTETLSSLLNVTKKPNLLQRSSMGFIGGVFEGLEANIFVEVEIVRHYMF